jgi:hypothetical protein
MLWRREGRRDTGGRGEITHMIQIATHLLRSTLSTQRYHGRAGIEHLGRSPSSPLAMDPPVPSSPLLSSLSAYSPTLEWVILSFNQDTITPTDYPFICSITVAIYLLYFLICYTFIKEKKRLAWCISLLNSCITTLICIVYALVKTLTSRGLFNANLDIEMIHGNDNISTITCLMFFCVNLLDLLLGLIFYRSCLGLMTTYVHHTLYMWLMVFLLTGNGFFTSTPTPFSMAFIWCLIEELPTFLLALGSVFPSYRADLSFGVSFFFLRLLYHCYLFLLMVRLQTYTPILFLYGLTFVMHLEWFRAWFTKYGLSYLVTKKSKRAD